MSPEEAIGEIPFGPSSILRGKVDCRDIFFFFLYLHIYKDSNLISNLLSCYHRAQVVIAQSLPRLHPLGRTG